MPLVRTGRKIVIGSQGGKRARKRRTATTELRIGKVELQPPKKRPGDGPLEAWLVRVLETEPPAGQDPLEWLLVSSEGGPTAEWAERIVGWYEARWGIEEYFRVLKSGARIEDRRLRQADSLEKCLAFDAITAWRVFSLERYAPDIRSWVVLLARMAGWRPTKRQPLPGNEVLWRACVQMQTMVRVTQAARAP